MVTCKVCSFDIFLNFVDYCMVKFCFFVLSVVFQCVLYKLKKLINLAKYGKEF